ncbi:Transmembrane_domain-containing protein [Hexamita inflata]|uniref:Transmembrane domain-containing protein n=1 Tax=Hexamita inflata TaxID=28002 RepID=A0AA86PYQ1_9EUKA|nr:Transmembrane domain-containing protein [Hexamita inflata]
MILVPYIVVIVITVATMFFYHQFTLLYVYFRQRCLKRVTAQNFMVLLQNIPSILNEREKTYKVIDPMMSGVKTIIPVPSQCNKLTKLSQDLDSLQLELEKMKRYVSTSALKQQYTKTQIKCNKQLLQSKIIELANIKTQIDISDSQLQKSEIFKKANKEILKLEHLI